MLQRRPANYIARHGTKPRILVYINTGLMLESCIKCLSDVPKMAFFKLSLKMKYMKNNASINSELTNTNVK